MNDVTLYDYWRSSASYRVRIALNLANISYYAIVVDLIKPDHKSVEHRVRNPQGLVPVLDIDGQRLTQSLAIVDYLDETRGLGLMPDDPVRRAKVNALAHTLAVDVHPSATSVSPPMWPKWSLAIPCAKIGCAIS